MRYDETSKKPELMPRETTTRWLIAVATCAALVSVIYIGKIPYGGQPQVGKVADRDIYAPLDFSFNAGVNTEKTEELRKNAALLVRDVYDIDTGVYENAKQNIKILFDTIKEVKAAEKLSPEDRLTKLKSVNKLELTDSDHKALLGSSESENTEAMLLTQLDAIFSQGILSTEEKDYLKKQDRTVIRVRNPAAKIEYDVEIKNLKTTSDTQNLSSSFFVDSPITDGKLKSAMRDIITAVISANLKSNVAETANRREKAITSVLPQEKLIDIVQGELIIKRGERVTPFHVAKFEALRAASVSEQKFALSILGISFIVVALVIMAALYLKYYEPAIYSNNRRLFLIAFMIVVITAIGKAIFISSGPPYFVPVAIVPILIGLLLGVRPALVTAVVLSFLAGLVMGERFDSTLIFIAGSVVGIYSIKAVRKRSQLFKAGVVVGVTSAVCVVGLGILNNLESNVIFKDASMFLMNGVAVGIIIVGTLHIFESLFKITTNISLLELADPNNPLLKELILKAPGTYHHSLIVGNLAEAACDAIGANGLLARVGSYYHDIGKVEKSEYFSENQPISESQHDKLAPTMSSLIIINHVKDGLEKAKRGGLNSALTDFIEQHHGTGLIYYFYQRALESIEDLNKLEEEGFRYPGPKPQTKETAIVHLADSVEAASRTLQNPTPANLEELVRRIINNKFIDAQLDECDLTLKDLNIIAANFTKVLTGVYHTRVQYPNDKEKNGA